MGNDRDLQPPGAAAQAVPPGQARAAAISKRNNVRVIGATHGERGGDGPPTLLFAHGYGCDQSMWRDVTPAFAAHYRIVLFDYVGAGCSDPAAYDAQRYGSLDGYVQDVLDICEALALQNVVFIGHSASAIVGALASLREPARFAQLVMICPSPHYLNDPPDYRGGFERADVEAMLDLMASNFGGWADTLAPVVAGDGAEGKATRELTRSFCAMDPLIARRWARVIFFGDNRADLPAVTTPTLIVQCTQDALAPVSVGDYMHSRLPNSTLQHMPVTGHCPHMTDPDATAALIRCYLGRPQATATA